MPPRLLPWLTDPASLTARIRARCETQARVATLLKHHMAADLTRSIMVNNVEAAIRVGRMKREAGPATARRVARLPGTVARQPLARRTDRDRLDGASAGRAPRITQDRMAGS